MGSWPWPGARGEAWLSSVRLRGDPREGERAHGLQRGLARGRRPGAGCGEPAVGSHSGHWLGDPSPVCPWRALVPRACKHTGHFSSYPLAPGCWGLLGGLEPQFPHLCRIPESSREDPVIRARVCKPPAPADRAAGPLPSPGADGVGLMVSRRPGPRGQGRCLPVPHTPGLRRATWSPQQ